MALVVTAPGRRWATRKYSPGFEHSVNLAAGCTRRIEEVAGKLWNGKISTFIRKTGKDGQGG